MNKESISWHVTVVSQHISVDHGYVYIMNIPWSVYHFKPLIWNTTVFRKQLIVLTQQQRQSQTHEPYMQVTIGRCSMYLYRLDLEHIVLFTGNSMFCLHRLKTWRWPSIVLLFKWTCRLVSKEV